MVVVAVAMLHLLEAMEVELVAVVEVVVLVAVEEVVVLAVV